MTWRVLLCCLALACWQPAGAMKFCKYGQQCWPSARDVDNLRRDLDPTLPRNLTWRGMPAPRVSAVPLGSPNDQPLYGAGARLEPLYAAAGVECGEFTESTPLFCFQAIRNNPTKGQPAFVAWPTNIRQVQALVKFAKKHRLCISVAGTGHDFLNRHSCEDAPGLFIRTSLFKDATFNLADPRGPAGTVTFGAGHTFSEAHQKASAHGRFVASGWSNTVGVIGWALGGGHGPYSPSVGLGVDNIVEVRLINAEGRAIVANADTNADLWWALRGGGGSTWGVITHITVRLHTIPRGGFTLITAGAQDLLVNEGEAKLSALLDGYLAWAATSPPQLGGLLHVTPIMLNGTIPVWQAYFKYVYTGGPGDDLVKATVEGLKGLVAPANQSIVEVRGFNTTWDMLRDQDLEPIIPVNWYPDMDPFVDIGGPVGGVPSVLLNASVVASGAVRSQMLERLADCHRAGVCMRQELYHDVTGSPGSPRDPNVALPATARTAVLHYVFSGIVSQATAAEYYKLGNTTYFSESAYHLPYWQYRYWGENYPRLLAVKDKYDPNRQFGCRHCVGDTRIA